MNRTLDDLSRVSIGQAARDALDLLQQEIQEAQYKIDEAMYRRLEDGRLTPEGAMIAFAEKHALYRVLRSLNQRAAAGANAAKRLAQPQRI